MKLYRGVPRKICNKYSKQGVPKGSLFSTNIKVAKHWGECIIVVNKSSSFKPHENNNTYKLLKIKDRDYFTTKLIKKFKLKDVAIE